MATHSSVLAWRIPMDRGIWWVTAHEVANSWTRLSTHIALKDSLKSKSLIPAALFFILLWVFGSFCISVQLLGLFNFCEKYHWNFDRLH